VQRLGPTGAAKRQAFLHVGLWVPLLVVGLIGSAPVRVATLLMFGLAAWATSRPFRTPVTVTSELCVRGHDRIGAGHSLDPARAGVRATFGLYWGVFVPIVFPAQGRSLTLWSLACNSPEEAERWVQRLFAGTGVAVDPHLHS